MFAWGTFLERRTLNTGEEEKVAQTGDDQFGESLMYLWWLQKK